jgi:outer membrane protein assembly factor BamA
MRPVTLVLLMAVCAGPAASQNAAFPLESVNAEGSSMPQAAILELSGLRIGSQIDKTGIEEACRKLQETGMFTSISYRYAPGPKKGYAVTLALADQPAVRAAIDVPGVDENEAWTWLASKFPQFNRKVPQSGAAQKYIAQQLGAHLGPALHGQALVVTLESDLKTRAMIASFQPENLPRLSSIAFAGNRAVASADLNAVLNPILAEQGYTDRRFADAIEMNLRPLYEERGLYRVRFAPGASKWTDAGVSVAVEISEGESYKLGKVEIAGEDLPVNTMLAAGKLPAGGLANWKQIQSGIWDMEKVVKRTGFMDATALPERIFRDEERVLDLRISVQKGDLYRYGEIRISGLTPALEQKARQMLRIKSGDPFDYGYPSEFIQTFSRAVDLSDYRKLDATVKDGAGEHVRDVTLVFLHF